MVKRWPTIQKPDFFVRFSNGFNKIAAKAIRKSDLKCPKNDHSNTGQSGIWWFTVHN
jgi:hypothetical protein